MNFLSTNTLKIKPLKIMFYWNTVGKKKKNAPNVQIFVNQWDSILFGRHSVSFCRRALKYGEWKNHAQPYIFLNFIFWIQKCIFSWEFEFPSKYSSLIDQLLWCWWKLLITAYSARLLWRCFARKAGPSLITVQQNWRGYPG